MNFLIRKADFLLLPVLTWVLCFALLPVGAAERSPSSPGGPQAGENPADHLPSHISRVTWFGERADWSHDGQRILVSLENLRGRDGAGFEDQGHSQPHGALSASRLHAGVLPGQRRHSAFRPGTFDPKRIGEARVQCWLFVLDKSGPGPPAPLGTKCSEGPAVSRKRMHIAWTHVAAQYPDEMPPAAPGCRRRISCMRAVKPARQSETDHR